MRRGRRRCRGMYRLVLCRIPWGRGGMDLGCLELRGGAGGRRVIGACVGAGGRAVEAAFLSLKKLAARVEVGWLIGGEFLAVGSTSDVQRNAVQFRTSSRNLNCTALPTDDSPDVSVSRAGII